MNDRPAACRAAEALGHDYDHYDPAFALDPHADYAKLRAACPVAYTGNYGGFFVVSRFRDLNEVLHDAKAFSSWPADTPPTPGHSRALIPLEVDPPEHRRYRMIIDPIFRPRAIGGMADEIRSRAAELAARMAAEREFDFMEKFGRPFPGAVFLRLVGLDFSVEQRDQLCDWAGTILHTTTEGATHGDVEAQTAARLKAGRALNTFLRGLLDERLETPGEDILSRLIDAELPGQRKMDYHEILNFAYVLVLAGLDTVTTALGFSFLHLARRPDLQDRIAADPSLIPGAVEELLRYEPIVHASRTVMESRVLGGTQLQPGDRVVLPLASAHRDEEAFPDANELLIDRKIASTLVFGGGSHRCVGMHLARMELTIAFEEIFRRIPRFSLPPDAVLETHGGQTRSLMNLPFRTWRDD
ncbi:cytochrome P450 [Frankia gtarii]|uniref:cytochrome P450 n=1 Tax=Frankia gtarii TaxID=2950102 RepID=UPI0021C06F4A|nr:cytochrome P450 [Frankia gtarii]